jgi:CubicO group peptidase (beta-lactamase class C family)
MRRLVLFFFLLLPQTVRAAEFDAKHIDAVVERAMKAFQVPGAAVVVVKDDEVIYSKGFGVREKGKNSEVTPNTVFPIASCSKAFTSALIAMLVDEGKLSWDDKVHKHLDYFRLSDELADRDVTLRDLLCHRTGMPRHDMIWAGLSNNDSGELIRRWGKGVPSTSFRSTWEYSNVPFTTAGVIAGKLEKGTWANAIEQRIFKPLEMSSSCCTSAGGQAASDRTTPHYFGLDKSISPIKWDEIDQAGGAGCINSTATDMGNWLRFQLADGKFGTKRLLLSKVLNETRTPQMLMKAEGVWALYFPPNVTRFTSYGLGWFVHDYRGFDCVSHGGTLSGIRAQCMMIPAKKIGVFAVCNLRPCPFPEAVTKTTIDHLLGLPVEDWVGATREQLIQLDAANIKRMEKREKDRKKNTKPGLALKEYAGNFDEPAYGRAEVSVEDDKLVLRWGRYTFRLEHYHFDTFTAIAVKPADEVFQFDRSTYDVLFRLGTNGEVDGVKFFDQEFKKAKGK